jgi:outer membrane lipoprotein carrier protein
VKFFAFLKASVAIGFVVFTYAVVAQTADSAALKLSALLSEMTTLEAQFQQTIVDDKGIELQQAQGYLTVMKPDNFYWRTEQPYEHLLVTQGDILWLYDIDLEQVSKQILSDDLSQTPALLLGGDVEKIREQYSISERQNSTDDELVFKLMPKSESSVFNDLTISFKQGVIYSMAFSDHFDQLTTIVFSAAKINSAIDLNLFKFTPPAGVDVIDNSSEVL